MTSYPIRIARSTTGAVHAARTVEVPTGHYEGEIGNLVWVGTGSRTEIQKACGFDSNTAQTRYAGTLTLDPQTLVTCKKCLKAIS